MNLIYILVILVVVTAEVPKIYSEFVTEDSCDEESDYYEKPAKGFSIKELLFWFKNSIIMTTHLIVSILLIHPIVKMK